MPMKGIKDLMEGEAGVPEAQGLTRRRRDQGEAGQQ